MNLQLSEGSQTGHLTKIIITTLLLASLLPPLAVELGLDDNGAGAATLTVDPGGGGDYKKAALIASHSHLRACW